MDELAVVARDSDAREGGRKHFGAGRIHLIENQAGTGAVREGGEQAGADRRFQNQIRDGDSASERSEVGDRGGGRELLKLNLLLAAGGMRGQAGDQPGQCGKAIARTGWQVGLRQVHDLGEFEHVVSVAKRPATVGRGSAIGLLHDPQQRVALERSLSSDGVGDRLGGRDRRFGEIEFESCG